MVAGFGGQTLPLWITPENEQFSEPKALLRYLGNLYGYYPQKDILKSYECDLLVDVLAPLAQLLELFLRGDFSKSA